MNRARQANRLFLTLVLLHTGLSFLLAFLPVRIPINFYGSILLSQLQLIVPAFLIWRFCGGRWENIFGGGRFRLKLALLGVLVMALFMPLFNFLNALSMLFVKNQTLENLQGVQDKPFLVNLVFIALLPAVCEEFVFRGALYGTYRKFGARKALFVSALLFGFLHMNFNQFIYTVAAGILFALLFEGTGSLVYSMLAHFLMNGTSVFVLAVAKWSGQSEAVNTAQATDLQTVYGKYLWIVYAVYAIIAILGAALGVLAYWALLKQAGRMDHMRAILKGEYRYEKERVLTPSLIVGAVICIAYMLFLEWFV